MNLVIKFILALSLLLLNKSYAGEVDLQLEINIPDTSSLEFGQVLPFSITVTNFGPDDAAGDSTAFLPNAVFISNIVLDSNGFVELLIVRDSSIEQECLFFLIDGSPPPPPFPQNLPLDYIINMPIIPANSSITCYGKIKVTITQERIIPFNVRAFQTDTETILDNNSIDVVFKLKPRIIPTLSFNSILILLISILLIVKYYYRSHIKVQ